MHKGMAWLLALAMLLMTFGATAEGTYTMAGFDGDGSNHDWNNNRFFDRMEEKTGITFEYQQVNDYDQWCSVKASYASGETEMPDVLFKAGLTPVETQEWFQTGKIIDLKPYLAEHAPNLSALLAANPDWEKAITLPTGEISALPQINELQNNNAMWINRQWLENLGLSVPTTAEELTEVLRAFRDNDPNRNGKDDEIPLTFLTMWDLKFLGHAYGMVANDFNVYLDETGTVRTTLDSDENYAFLTWLHQLWEEELIDHTGFSSTDTVRAITDKDAPITYGVMLAPTPLSLVPNSALEQYDLLMPMVYEGKQVYRDLGGDVMRGAFAISSACKNPAELVAWVDYLYSEEGCRLAQAGLEGEEYEWHEDGTWSWLADPQTVASTVLSEVTMSEGGIIPGISSVEFQRAYDEKETARAISALVGLKQVSVEPYPLVWLTAEEESKLAALQMEIGKYADLHMTWFVTGDLPLNDDTWNDFCNTLTDMGVNEIVAILQNAVK